MYPKTVCITALFQGGENDGVPSAKTFVKQLLEPDAQRRLTVEQAINHSVRMTQ